MSAEEAAPSQPDSEPKKTLVSGSRMRCPNCEMLRDPVNQREFKRLDRIEEYKDELNIVYQCVKSTGGCGHVFSPTDAELTSVIRAWLSGDLVARHTLDHTVEKANGGQS